VVIASISGDCEYEWWLWVFMVTVSMSGDCEYEWWLWLLVVTVSMSGEYEWWLWVSMSVNGVSVILFLFFFTFFYFSFYIKLNSAQQYPSQALRVIFFIIKKTETNTYIVKDWRRWVFKVIDLRRKSQFIYIFFQIKKHLTAA
jgi:hypothetical protein